MKKKLNYENYEFKKNYINHFLVSFADKNIFLGNIRKLILLLLKKNYFHYHKNLSDPI